MDESLTKILIAEDHPDQARLLATILRRWGYDPLVVHDGLSALRVLQSPDAPRLVLLDWGLPEMDGIEVCEEVRKNSPGPYTYIVLVTGRAGREERLAGLEAGADDFLSKPVDEPELKARLNTGRRILNLQGQLMAAHRRLEEQATRDALTGVWNRGAILEILARELARARRAGQPMGVLLADLDHFKDVNDTHGHLAGDQVLRRAAQRMRDSVRPYDAVGRYGGEEFLIVLPGCSGKATMTLGERLRRSVANEPVDLGDSELTVTVSLGAACWSPGRESDTVKLLLAADAALYRAKHAGRNQTVFAEEETLSSVGPV